jgi:hypothetical protein
MANLRRPRNPLLLELIQILLWTDDVSEALTRYLSQVAACILDGRLPLSSTEARLFVRYLDILYLLADPGYPLECQRILLLTHFKLTFILFYRTCR